jgi:hypothetical protein
MRVGVSIDRGNREDVHRGMPVLSKQGMVR